VKTQNPDSINANPPDPERENVETENPKSGFLVLQFAVTGGAVLVAGIATTAVLRKRKSRNRANA
jgi:hypothetical protein